jgi:hypothetical protein
MPPGRNRLVLRERALVLNQGTRVDAAIVDVPFSTRHKDN